MILFKVISQSDFLRAMNPESKFDIMRSYAEDVEFEEIVEPKSKKL